MRGLGQRHALGLLFGVLTLAFAALAALAAQGADGSVRRLLVAAAAAAIAVWFASLAWQALSRR
jgi:hypothetical protein